VARAQLAVVEADPLLHADQAVPAAVSVGAVRAAVDDLQLELRGRPAHGDRGRRGAGVLDRIGERLLDDAVGGQVDAGRQRARLALDGERDGESGGARALDEAVELAHGRLRRAVVGVVHHAEQAPHLGQSGAPGILDV